jgi:hypothetical protein
VDNIKATVPELSGGVDIYGGAGGVGGNTGGNGGAGGKLSNVTLTTTHWIDSGVDIFGGNGGSAPGDSATGTGGAGGDATGITVNNKGGLNSLDIRSGAGGDSGATTGDGGRSGNLSKVTVNSTADIVNTSTIGAPEAGSAGTTGNGGLGGNATDLTINDKFGSQGEWFISAASGGNGNGAGGKGGNAGMLKTVTFNGPNSNVQIGDDDTSAFGGNDTAAMGGNGGTISGIKGSAATLRLVALAGGFGGSGIGGNGGSIDNVTFSVTKFARIIAAGDGGDSNAPGTAGTGGSITKVKITGSGVIGDFGSNFSVNGDNNSGMGGLIAGRGGADGGVFSVDRNGSITSVTATRIAAIIAGANAGAGLNNFNAVKSIAGLTASHIGADVDGDRQFDWTENTSTQVGFQLPGAPTTTDLDDVPRDGIVIVKTGAFTPAASTVIFKPVIFV